MHYDLHSLVSSWEEEDFWQQVFFHFSEVNKRKLKIYDLTVNDRHSKWLTANNRMRYKTGVNKSDDEMFIWS